NPLREHSLGRCAVHAHQQSVVPAGVAQHLERPDSSAAPRTFTNLACHWPRPCCSSMLHETGPDRTRPDQTGGHLAASTGIDFDEGNAEATDPVERKSSRPDFMVLV